MTRDYRYTKTMLLILMNSAFLFEQFLEDQYNSLLKLEFHVLVGEQRRLERYELLELSPDDKEVKKISVFTTAANEVPASLLQRFDYFSDRFRAKRAIAVCRRYRDVLRERMK